MIVIWLIWRGFNMNEKFNENIESVNHESIYHYCGFNTFFEIIKNKTIRLSDITQSNDHDEIKWSAHIIINAFDNYYDKIFKKEEEIKIAKEIIQNNIEYFIENKTYSVLACCFSEKKDLLSQWRGYSEDGKGFSIGYSSKMISELINEIDTKNCKIIFGKVSYEEDTQIAIINSEIRKFFSENDIDNIDDFDKNVPILFENLFEKIIYFKNPFFSEECEWRVCLLYKSSEYLNIKINDENLDFYTSCNKIIPFVDLPFENKKGIMIDVMCGPKNKAEKIKDFLGINNIVCNVYESKGTYR